MDAANLPGFVKQALDSWYPGRSSEAIEGTGDELGWVLQLDETILAAPVSFEHRATLDDLRTRLDTSTGYGQRWTVDVLQRFGGRRFGREDWGLMSF